MIREVVISLHCYIVKVASLDNLLFFLLIAVAALFQLLSKALSKSKKESDQTPKSPAPKMPHPIRRAPIESDADRIRKFLEALGQPPTTTPPPPVARRTDIPPRRLAPVQPPPVVIPRAWGLPREQQTKGYIGQREISPPEQPRHVKFVRPTVPAPVAPEFEVREGASALEFEQPIIVKTRVEADIAAARPIAKEPDFKTEVTTLLGSKSGLREAIILREIFGPPRGLQGHEIGA